ncbi:T-cell surface glycoprotein CD4-like [Enoplosus armatus]|uniref:T-cell surface glycoprotein CD4-like n=1 Tax=Enoplosus armatus TaxID=215367 RepID=UPI003994AC78
MKTIMWFGFVLGALSAAGKVILSKPGGKASFECGVGSFSNLVWNRGNNLITNLNGKTGFNRKGKGDIVGRSSVKNDRTLEISRVKEEDAGKFTCVVDGKTQEFTLLVVSVSASPSGDLHVGSEATLQCRVKGLDQGSTVQWKKPDGSPHAGSHTVELKSLARSDAGFWQCTFSHGGEMFNMSLGIKVIESALKTPAPFPSQGSKGVHKPGCTNCVTSPPPNAALLPALHWWVWVAVGIGCLVVVLLMVFVIVLCKRIRRRKRKLQKMKYDRQLLKSKQYCQCNRPAAAAKPQQGRRREKPSALPLQPQLME